MNNAEQNFSKIISEISNYFISIKPYNKFIIGLSGGLDSMIVTALASIAVGKENIICYNLPTRFNTDSIQRAEVFARNLGVQFEIKSIESLVNYMLNDLNLPDIERENLQARIRGITLQTLASANKGVVLTCSNKSERMLGYFTYASADDIGALAPIGDLYKSEVYDIAKFINEYKPGTIPQELYPDENHFIKVKPSAELFTHQEDPWNYFEVDEFLRKLEKDDFHIPDMTNEELKWFNLFDKNSWKLQQGVPIIELL